MIGPFTYPQIAMALVLAASALASMLVHGHPKGGVHSFPVAAVRIIGLIALLAWGGFWTLQ